MVKRLVGWFRGIFADACNPVPLSLFPVQEAPEEPQSPTANLYVLTVDFPVSPDNRHKIDKSLDPLRDKYGLDFLLLEPGIKLSRFDDI